VDESNARLCGADFVLYRLVQAVCQVDDEPLVAKVMAKRTCASTCMVVQRFPLLIRWISPFF